MDILDKKVVLLVEDEQSIADTVIYAFESEGVEVIHCGLGEVAVNQFNHSNIDLAILDIGLPDISGFDVCREIRKISNVPILFLTARDEEIDRIVGFELGADDYVAKPFSPRELTARVKAILRRLVHLEPPSDIESLFTIDENKFEITYRNEILELTRYEYFILNALLARPGYVLSRGQLLEANWHEAEGIYDRVIDTHIKQIRAKLRLIAKDANPIKTHRGLGYSVDVNG